MIRVKTMVLVFVCVLFASIQPLEAQEAEVRAAMEESLAAWRNGEYVKLGGFYANQTRGYMLDGGYLISGFNVQALEAAASMGVAFDVAPRDIDIMMVGDNVAVAVAMLEGSVTLPGGAVQEGTWRYSETRVNEGGAWKVVQYHFSPFTLAPIGDVQ